MGQIVFMRVEGWTRRDTMYMLRDEKERFQEIQDRSRSQNIENAILVPWLVLTLELQGSWISTTPPPR